MRPLVGEGDDAWIGQGLVGECFDRLDRRTPAQLVAPGSQHVAPVKDGGLFREAMGAEQRFDPTPRR